MIAWALDHRVAVVVIAMGTFMGAFLMLQTGMIGLAAVLLGTCVSAWLVCRAANWPHHRLGALFLSAAVLGGAFQLARLVSGGLDGPAAIVGVVVCWPSQWRRDGRCRGVAPVVDRTPRAWTSVAADRTGWW